MPETGKVPPYADNQCAIRLSMTLHDLGVEVGSSTPEAFATYIHIEIPKWAAVVKASGAQVE